MLRMLSVNSWFICAVHLFLVFITNCCGCPNVDSSLDKAWQEFKSTYQKNYDKNEECQRRLVWQSNLLIIKEHNVEADAGKHTYWMDMNAHGDRSDDEIIKMYLGGYKPELSSTQLKTKEPDLDHQIDKPRQVDWRDRGCNIPSNDQQPCGSCYIFASLAALECHQSIKNSKIIDDRLKNSRRLSVQQIIDCAERMDTLNGCNGGFPQSVYAWDIFASQLGIGGFVADSCYPFTGIDKGTNCSQELVNNCDYRIHVHSYQVFSIYLGETNLQNLIADKGPVVAAMSVLPSEFRWYKRGVYNSKKCSQYNINHVVALWGYGGGQSYSKEPRFWIIKNSFGSSWGDNGYAKISRDDAKNCNLEVDIVLPEAVDKAKI